MWRAPTSVHSRSEQARKDNHCCVPVYRSSKPHTSAPVGCGWKPNLKYTVVSTDMINKCERKKAIQKYPTDPFFFFGEEAS
ncbi:uncharacterized protein PHALS_04989 [Plasmopara halstedii]|uniref:Uncharacterized protein n=1 Tax=Plasmopara halstedii TaxID=4781 RepID=A0A0N7L413_PLAHL|nr:uncharacterized protein PHALS_04989 [Plasmopara halstedii]CEG37395.1 hypothetical protein PHALS_04989 [Plasmopara halstedii]|eukprot:XP_024573764.1 hypothetical protein PHALS_04989 [Plasmopara halstedii]